MNLVHPLKDRKSRLDFLKSTIACFINVSFKHNDTEVLKANEKNVLDMY